MGGASPHGVAMAVRLLPSYRRKAVSASTSTTHRSVAGSQASANDWPQQESVAGASVQGASPTWVAFSMGVTAGSASRPEVISGR